MPVIVVWGLALSRAVGADDQWINAAGGLFNAGSNWMDGTAPGASDTASFNLSANYIVQWNNNVGNIVNRRLFVPRGEVTLLATGGDFVYSLDDPVDQANFGGADIFGGRLVLGALSGGSLSLDAKNQILLGKFGSLDIGVGSEVVAMDVQVGAVGDGMSSSASVFVRDGGRLETDFLQTGGFESESGFVQVEGTGSTVVTDFLFAGFFGTGNMNVFNGANLVSSQTAYLGYGPASDGAVSVGGTGANSSWNANFVYIGGVDSGASGRGSLTILNGGLVTASTLTVWSGGHLDVLGGTLTTSDLFLNGGSLRMFPFSGMAATVNVTNPVGVVRLSADSLNFGSLVLNADTILRVAGTTILEAGVRLQIYTPSAFSSAQVVNNGRIEAFSNLTIGDATRHGAYTGAGELHVQNGATVTLNDAGFADLGFLTQLNGTLNAPNGVAVPVGGDVVASGGSIMGNVSAAAGSIITVASGSLSMGDAMSLAGIAISGELRVNGRSVTLLDSNLAELGTRTTLGPGGLLRAANGAVVDFADSIVGFGTVDTPNDPLRPMIVNGHASGDAAFSSLTFLGYVKGVGTFDDVTFTGTHSPGLSTATLNTGNVSYTNSATLDIELAGSGFDQIKSNNTIAIDGTLKVDLLSGFTPLVGQRFDILTAVGGISGTFDTQLLPQLGNGLAFRVLYSPNAVSLHVISALPGDYNLNGAVDAADYVVWRNSLGETGTDLAADGNGNSQVDAGDYEVWRANFGQTAAASTLASNSIPEPRALTMFLVGLLTTHLCGSARRVSCTAVYELHIATQ
jgi:T5SS/PEP-CTERM-associated repeat protein